MKLAYVVTEAGCMDETTGANQHIAMGMRELSKHTELIAFLPPAPEVKPDSVRATDCTPNWRTLMKKSGVWGAARDLRNVWRMSRQGWRLARDIEKAGCKIVYVRVQALHPISLFLRWRKIKVVLEANGLQHRTLKARSKSWLAGLYQPFERYVYRKADHVFFVGSYGQYWGLDAENWTEVENGVEPSLFVRRDTEIGKSRPFRLVLLARLVAHHKGNLLSEAIGLLSPSLRGQLEVHLVGGGFEQLKVELQPFVRVEDHGFVPREKIGELLRQMDCGVIPDCPPYGSQMKLLDYAASGCLVLAPDVFHLKNFFSDKGVLFFDRSDSTSFSEALTAVLLDEVKANEMACCLQNHVREIYTWDVIFREKWNVIKEITNADNGVSLI